MKNPIRQLIGKVKQFFTKPPKVTTVTTNYEPEPQERKTRGGPNIQKFDSKYRKKRKVRNRLAAISRRLAFTLTLVVVCTWGYAQVWASNKKDPVHGKVLTLKRDWPRDKRCVQGSKTLKLKTLRKLTWWRPTKKLQSKRRKPWKRH